MDKVKFFANKNNLNLKSSATKQWRQDVFDKANIYATDYILRDKDDPPLPYEPVFCAERFDGVAEALADFDPIRVLDSVIKVLEETEEVGEQELAAALGKTLTVWSEKWSMPEPSVHSGKAIN